MIALTALLIGLRAVAALSPRPARGAPAGAGVSRVALGAWAAIAVLAALEFVVRPLTP
jgi:hypothetical protein